MADYRTPLPRLLAASLEAGINRVIHLDPAGPERLLRLQGRNLQLDLEGLEITLYLGFESGNVRVTLDPTREPDTVISASPAALLDLAAPEDASRWGLPGSQVSISGDATLARDLERVFSKLEPDWQQPLSTVFGETLAFQIASGIEQGARSLRDTAREARRQAGDWLREDTELVVPREQFRAFSDELERFRDAVARLEARVRLAEERRA